MPQGKPQRSRDWLDVWNAAKSQGMTRSAMAKSLNMTNGRLNDVILGRAKPTAKERSAMDGKRKATRIFWKDKAGDVHSYYTGQGLSFRQLVYAGDLDTIANEDDRYTALDSIIDTESGWIKRGGVKVHSQDSEWRRRMRQISGR